MIQSICLTILAVLTLGKNAVRWADMLSLGMWGAALGEIVAPFLMYFIIIAVVRLIARRSGGWTPAVQRWTAIAALILAGGSILTRAGEGGNGRSFADADKYLCGEGAKNDSIEICTKLIESRRFWGRDFAILYNNRGLQFHNTGQSERALRDFDRALEIDATLASAWHNRGLAEFGAKRFDKAIENFTRAGELNPAKADIWASRCYVYIMNQEYDLAVKDCDRAVALDPKLAIAWANRGIARTMRDDPGALDDIEQAIKLDPENPKLRQTLETLKSISLDDE